MRMRTKMLWKTVLMFFSLVWENTGVTTASGYKVHEGRGGMATEAEGCVHTTSTARKHWLMLVLSLFSPSILIRIPAHNIVLPYLGWIFSLQLNRSKKVPHRHLKMLVSLMILDPVKLKISIDHHSFIQTIIYLFKFWFFTIVT